MIEGAPPRNPRARTEIWYRGEVELAKAVAARLAPLIGEATPQAWKWGGPYEVIVIVGDR